MYKISYRCLLFKVYIVEWYAKIKDFFCGRYCRLYTAPAKHKGKDGTKINLIEVGK